MPPKGKSKAKSSVSPSFAHVEKSSPSQLQAPFYHAPKNLEPFLAQLSQKHVYITSVDNTPWQFKAQIFAVPMLMNVAIIGLLLWRILTIGPYYVKICYSLTGIVNETTMNVEEMTWQEILYAIGSRTLNFLTDFVLFYMVLWPWPKAFFGPNDNENPVVWRLSIGFRDQEITVRRSRRWDEALEDIVTEEGEGSEEGGLFLTNVRRATSRAFMHEKTGYSMLNKDWDLDWRLMILATKMVDKKEMSLDDFKTTVLLYSSEFGWVTFETQDNRASRKEDEGRRKILAFKDELTAMGKESLFFRWIELIQLESSQPGGFGSERQEVAIRKARDMFEAQGVDFDKFWAKIGGMEGMHGMDQV